jgi:DNA repair protein RadC
MAKNYRNIKSWAEEDRPREKLMQNGKESLTDSELLAILIGMGTTEMSALDLAKAILISVDHSLSKLASLSLKNFTQFKGMGPAKAVTLMAALELARRKTDSGEDKKITVTSSQIAYNLLKPHLLGLKHEEFWVILLNRRLELITYKKISMGGISGTIADPKIIFQFALENLASAIIISHNHPSGSLEPSSQDIALTDKIKEGAALLDITLSDHIIFTETSFFSFADQNRL